MKVYLSDPVGHQRSRIAVGVHVVPGSPVLCELAAGPDAGASRAAVEAAGRGSDGPALRIVLAHAQGVGRACPETEAWFARLEGFDLGILYSEAWLDQEPPVVELAEARWRAGTDLVLRNLGPLLAFLHGRSPADALSPELLVSPSWAPLVREHGLELLGHLLPVALMDGALPDGRVDACRGALDRVIAEVARARGAGRAASAGGEAPPAPWLAARGALRELAEVDDPDDARSVGHALLDDLLAAPRDTRSRVFAEWRDDLLRVCEALAGHLPGPLA